MPTAYCVAFNESWHLLLQYAHPFGWLAMTLHANKHSNVPCIRKCSSFLEGPLHSAGYSKSCSTAYAGAWLPGHT